MHEVFKIKSSKTNPKFQQYLINFEKPQNLKKKKIPKPRFQKHECMKCKRIEAYHVKKSLVKLEETSQFEGEKRVFGRENRNQSRERSRKWQADHTRSLNRTLSKSRQMRCRGGVETSVEQVSRKATSTDHVSRSCWGIKTPEARYEAQSIHQVSRSYREVRNFLNRSTRYRGADEIAIRKRLGSLTDS